MALLLFQKGASMGFVSNNPAATDDDARLAGAGDSPDSSESGTAAGGDGVTRGRDNSAKEADDWLPVGVEEAGYGYGV
jgi:hypothetical protein